MGVVRPHPRRSPPATFPITGGGDLPERPLAPVDGIARQLLFASSDHQPQPKRSGFIQVVGRIRELDGSNELALEENAMLKMIALIGVGTAIAFTPLPTIAQTAPAASAAAATAPTGSHQRQMRHRQNMSKERARASAEHMRHMRHMQHKPAPTP